MLPLHDYKPCRPPETTMTVLEDIAGTVMWENRSFTPILSVA